MKKSIAANSIPSLWSRNTPLVMMLAFYPMIAMARSAIEISLDVSGQTGSQGYSSVESAINALSSTSGLQTLVPSYVDTAPATATVDLRGLPLTASFAAGSPVLRVVIPAAGVDKTFNGVTRADSARQFQNWIEKYSGLDPLLAAKTPVDPVAGNPNSLMNQMVASDFNRALVDASTVSPPGFGLDARYGSFSASGFDSHSLSLPLGYSWRLSERDTVDLDLPISVTDVTGAKSYSGNIGMLWRRRMLTRWTLQASARIGGVGSTALGAGSGVWSVALNSTVNIDLPRNWQLTIADGITYIATIPISVGNYSLNYNLTNVVFRNGLVASRDLGFRIMNLPVRGALFIVDTQFTGSAVYVTNYQEFGLFTSIGSLTPVKLGATFMTGDKGIRGFSVNTGVRF